MQFMLMCCFEESRWENLAKAERDRIMSEYGQFVQELNQRGQLVSGAKLAATASSVSVREKSGKRFVTDGPFAETKEQLGGFHVIECRDLNEAVAIAQRIPTLPAGGVVEVRPLEYSE
jgi:hypothetical protein